MLTEPLPSSLDIRKAATRRVTVSGTLKPTDLSDYRAVLADDEGLIEASLECDRDEENRYLVKVSVSSDVMVTCQRCLEAMPAHFETETTLAVVWDDDHARKLPKDIEPLIVGDEGCDLWKLVEEELILAMPAFSYHQDKNCNELLSGLVQPPEQQLEEAGKPNPFNVLAQLKPGKKH